MTKLGWIIALLFALVLAFVWALPTTLLRYRITLEADIGGKPVSSSGVWHVEVETMLPVPVPGPPVELHGSGEAAAVDLGGRAPCFRAAGFRTPGECRGAAVLGLRCRHGPGSAGQGRAGGAHARAGRTERAAAADAGDVF